MRCHALQERFEDQSTSLKLAREGHGDIQVTLDLYKLSQHNLFMPSGTPYYRRGGFCREKTVFSDLYSFLTSHLKVKLEAETGKLRQEVFALQERNGFLQRSVEEYRRQLENQQEHAMVTRSEYEKRLKDECDGGHSRMQVLQERMLQVDRERTHATKEADDLRDLLTTAQRELITLKEQTQNIQTSLSELDTQVKDLTIQNHTLQAENSKLLERSNTISARYDTNDLVSRHSVFPEITDFPGCRTSKKKHL